MMGSDVLLALLDDCGTEEELRLTCQKISPLLADRGEHTQLVRAFHHHLSFLKERKSQCKGKGKGDELMKGKGKVKNGKGENDKDT